MIPQIVIVAFMEYDNLGVGYIASVLNENGFKTHIIDFRKGKEEILNRIKKIGPFVIGFSVIFQIYILKFKELINYLRESGITSHFSAGGQFASMRYNELFELIPSLDSIVRFEGEYIFLELVTQINNGTDWHNIRGVAYRKNGYVISNPLRTIETDLDKLPYPVRSRLREYLLGKKFATILAGRGCLNNCSFCNNTEYVRQSSLHFRRERMPEMVVEEMEFLYHKKNCSVFLFEDDDFPLDNGGKSGWVERFCYELKRRKLADKIIWKINCRPDEVDSNRFELMRNNGLYQVFLGIDDGTDMGLKKLNKRMTVAESLNGISILKKLDISFDFGFMLFQPSSTFKSIFQNLNFLGQICGDGFTPVIFLKMMPFFATKVERELEKEGRLKGGPGSGDYDFYDMQLDKFYNSLIQYFGKWIYHPMGFTNIARWARIYKSVFSHFYKPSRNAQTLYSDIQKVTSGLTKSKR